MYRNEGKASKIHRYASNLKYLGNQEFDEGPPAEDMLV